MAFVICMTAKWLWCLSVKMNKFHDFEYIACFFLVSLQNAATGGGGVDVWAVNSLLYRPMPNFYANVAAFFLNVAFRNNWFKPISEHAFQNNFRYRYHICVPTYLRERADYLRDLTSWLEARIFRSAAPCSFWQNQVLKYQFVIV